MDKELIKKQTKKWITDVVIACNFCPFAAKEVKRNSIRYQVSELKVNSDLLKEFLNEFEILDNDGNVETSLIIYPYQFTDFYHFLKWIKSIEKLLEKNDYDGIYQVASFHPHYLFAGSTNDDPANYTNRSPYPMLHILREESLEKIIEIYPNTEMIPENNIRFTHEKGLDYMKKLRDSCL